MQSTEVKGITMSQGLKLAFFATMSAGKTTCINALLGTELLHSANEATTATITTISYGETHHVTAYDKYRSLMNEMIGIDKNQLRALNENPEVEYIEIKSKFNMDKNLVIVDTPGPNNSRDDNHGNLAYKCLEEQDFDYVVYLINATQAFVVGEFSYLKDICDKIQKEKIIFVINKMDKFDTEKESVDSFFNNLKDYLLDMGFDEPVIFVVSAYHALNLKKLACAEKLTKKEYGELNQFIAGTGEEVFLPYLNLSQDLISDIQEQDYFEFLGNDFQDKGKINELYRKTGFPYLENFIHSKIKHGITNCKEVYPKTLRALFKALLDKKVLNELNQSVNQPISQSGSLDMNHLYIEHNPYDTPQKLDH